MTRGQLTIRAKDRGAKDRGANDRGANDRGAKDRGANDPDPYELHAIVIEQLELAMKAVLVY